MTALSPLVLPLADLVAIGVLALAIYFPRHRRRDLLIAFVAVNVGVLGVATALSSTSVTVGLGMGLFGVLSIIRLRSSELAQAEIAYYFISLALGLVAGLGVDRPVALGLMVLLVSVMAIVDSPRLLARHHQQVVVLDRALPSRDDLVAHLEQLLDARVHALHVLRLDLVDDSTEVDVRFSQRPSTPSTTQGADPRVHESLDA